MVWILDLLALIAALAGLVVSLAHGGYLFMLNAAARKRAGGGPLASYARGRYAIAAGATAAGLLAFLLADDGTVADVFAILIGGGASAYSAAALRKSREHLRVGGSRQ